MYIYPLSNMIYILYFFRLLKREKSQNELQDINSPYHVLMNPCTVTVCGGNPFDLDIYISGGNPLYTSPCEELWSDGTPIEKHVTNIHDTLEDVTQDGLYAHFHFHPANESSLPSSM